MIGKGDAIMEMTCHKCGYADDYQMFEYLCKNGCPACGESDLRRCPRCGTECVFSRAESLLVEQDRLKELSQELALFQKSDPPESLQKARSLIITLQSMNRRWNIDGLDRFLKRRQKELFFSPKTSPENAHRFDGKEEK